MLLNQAIPEAIKLADYWQESTPRKIACHMLAKIAEVLREEFVNIILHRALALAADGNSGVRATMCEEFVIIAKCIGPSHTETHLYPELIKLLSDDDGKVRVAALTALIDLLHYLSESFLEHIVVPIFRDDLLIDANFQFITVISKKFGTIL